MNFASPNFQPQLEQASKPGELLRYLLDDHGISARELARRCGRSGKLMVEILGGKAPVEPETALQFERVLGVCASDWLQIEATYQLHRARLDEAIELQRHQQWAQTFPLKEMSARGLIHVEKDAAKQVSELLRFFGVGSVKACELRIEELVQSDIRAAATFKTNLKALAVFLRLGELTGEQSDAPVFDRETFTVSLRHLKSLNRLPLNKEVIETIHAECSKAGVIHVITEPFSKSNVSFAARWLNPRRALIQQSCDPKAPDAFWFNFYHSAAHLLLHSRKSIYVDLADGTANTAPRFEEEAADWAADSLVPHSALRPWLKSFIGSDEEIASFAEELDVSPGLLRRRLDQLGIPMSSGAKPGQRRAA